MTTEITTLGSSDANCSLARIGSGFILIDTGLPTEREAQVEALEGMSCRPANLELVLLTLGIFLTTVVGAMNVSWI